MQIIREKYIKRYIQKRDVQRDDRQRNGYKSVHVFAVWMKSSDRFNSLSFNKMRSCGQEIPTENKYGRVNKYKMGDNK